MSCRVLLGSVLAGLILVSQAAAQDPPENVTADQPSSWLVLYNLNSDESVAWADWYGKEWDIPAENLVGLDAATAEHLNTTAEMRAQITSPLEAYFSNNPRLEERTMGLVVGYGLPTHFSTLPVGGPGGYSVANALQDMEDDVREFNPQAAQLQGALPRRLTKATLLPQHYLVGVIDAPTVELAMELTTRAREIAAPRSYINQQTVYFDYSDPSLPRGEWYWLRHAVEHPRFVNLPWQAFDDDTQQTLNDAFRFGAHDVDGWNDARLFGEPRGRRILAYNLNSWGATNLRSTSGSGGRYVPNALAAGYAAAIGATGEPGSVTGPFPWVLLAALGEGWTLGEAFYLANPQDDSVWICAGDPLLRVANWFDVPPPPPASPPDGAAD